MKFRFFVLTVIVLGFSILISSFVLADQAAYTTTIKKITSLVGYWPLDGDYKDSVGKADGATVGDAGAFAWVNGVNGGKAVTIDSAKFNGSFVDIPAAIGSVFDSANATTVIWAKLFARTGDYWQAITERDNLWYLETEVKAAEWKGNAVVFRIYDPVAVGGGGSDQVRDNVNVTMENDKWYQLAWTYDGAVLKGFVNGKQVLSKNYAGGLGPTAKTPNPPPAGKGKNYNYSLGTWQQRDDWFNGAIDSFAYFKDVLTEAQIKSLYDAMLTSVSPVQSQDKLAATWGEIRK